jgi:hypothetical protein
MNNIYSGIQVNPISFLLPKGGIDHGVVQTALELEIFEILTEEFLSLKEIKERCSLKIKERNLFDFLDFLYFNGHLQREGNDIQSVKYKNAHNFLVKSNPENYIPLVSLTTRFFKRFEILPFMMKEDRYPENVDIFTELFSDPEKTKNFLRAMGLLQKPNFEKIAKNFDFTSHKKVVDIGGCLGAFSIEIKKANPHLTCVSFDLPFVESHAKQFLEEKGMLEKIEVISGDMFKEDFPNCDVVSMGNILHDWNEEKKRLLLKKSYDCLNENGIMIVVELFMSNERNVCNPPALMSLGMLVECLDGFNMTRDEMEKYAKEAGFKKVEFLYEKFGVDASILYK